MYITLTPLFMRWEINFQGKTYLDTYKDLNVLLNLTEGFPITQIAVNSFIFFFAAKYDVFTKTAKLKRKVQRKQFNTWVH